MPRSRFLDFAPAAALHLSLPKKRAGSALAAPKPFCARYRRMSLEWIAIGVITCLFGMIALMPSFDGKWD
jgi:hypothetical protein